MKSETNYPRFDAFVGRVLGIRKGETPKRLFVFIGIACLILWSAMALGIYGTLWSLALALTHPKLVRVIMAVMVIAFGLYAMKGSDTEARGKLTVFAVVVILFLFGCVLGLITPAGRFE